MKRLLSEWCRETKKAMIDQDMTMNDLVSEVGYSRAYVSGVVNGRINHPDVAEAISKYLHITVPYTCA
ncbi:helix-turn-helix domain-containing protein [Parablautia sp. Marseille-Q6255]|uniref:helix-turn-helix domain-containing protein n=1 Tax=Parablautia sp. Marseille-Q6255 TaxID=3039593 RepID=UPI0024BC9D4D|nr:helix-turn-helix transcriptional regulator [Parablautia sp. Marseille-Q6255]